MKKTGKLFVVAASAMLATSALADDQVVVVTKSDQQTYDIDKVQRIDFSNDKLNVVSTGAEGTTYAFDEVVKIVFSTSTNAIDTPTAMQQQRLTITVSADGSQLRVNGWDASQATSLELYATSGASVARQAQWSGQTVDISSLPHGIYVVKVGGKTAKFRK